jgi:uncharacterized protein (TIGR03437 family)
VNAQLPFEVLAAGQTSGSVTMVVTVNNVPIAPMAVPVVPQAPGVFSIPSGVGTAVLVDITQGSVAFGAVAGPANANIGLATHPIPRGDIAYFYATGLGAMTPAVPDGSGTCPAADGICSAALPAVLIGNVSAQVFFAGQAPGFPGVYQVNIQIPANAPTGDGISVQMVSADGTVTSAPNTAVISVQ